MRRREQVFWGWGEHGAGPSLPDTASEFLRSALGVDGGVVSRAVGLEEVRLGEPSLPAGLLDSLRDVCPASDEREMRILRARGKSYLDLLDARSGALDDAPDAVVSPASHAEVLTVLQLCNEAGVAVVPFGGGTSVVGGVAPLRGAHAGVVSLDLARMDALVRVDSASLTAHIQPGIRLPECERALSGHGLTLGHFPQSFEWATVGGCVATRSSGQASTGYGRIDANVVAVRCATPLGDLSTLEVPGSAAGPRLRDLLVGSEGVFGVITEVALRVARAPDETRYEAWFVHSFEEGCEALRDLEQAGLAPAVARLSDEAETRVNLALAARHGLKARVGDAVLSARGYADGCLMILGWEGSRETVTRGRGTVARRLRDFGAMPVGRSAGEAWRANRYAGPHIRDDLMDRGVMVETLETATSWANLGRLYRTVVEALAGDGRLVMCHVSHLYPTGASLYFTVLGRMDLSDPRGQWMALKEAASEALVGAGGTITHHHAIGRDHAPWLGPEVGDLGLEVLRAVKERVDPAGIMNPGKLLPR